MMYGCDPYNTADALQLAHQIVRHYHGPLTAVAYRSQQHWDFAPGVSCAAKLAALQAKGGYASTLEATTELPAFLRRQAD
jgi:hypothetical protein